MKTSTKPESHSQQRWVASYIQTRDHRVREEVGIETDFLNLILRKAMDSCQDEHLNERTIGVLYTEEPFHIEDFDDSKFMLDQNNIECFNAPVEITLGDGSRSCERRVDCYFRQLPIRPRHPSGTEDNEMSPMVLRGTPDSVSSLSGLMSGGILASIIMSCDERAEEGGKHIGRAL
nr:hypothetical protein L204_04033 [Cryptococcus depauperatus CBS 7855]